MYTQSIWPITKWLTSSDRNHKIFPYIPVRKVVYNGKSVETLNKITMERVGTLNKTTKPIGFSNRRPNDSQNTIFFPRPPPQNKRLQNNIHTFCYQNGSSRNIILLFCWELLPFAVNRIVWVSIPTVPSLAKGYPWHFNISSVPSTSHHLPGLWKFGDFKGGSDGLSDGPFLNGFLTFPSVLSSPFLK